MRIKSAPIRRTKIVCTIGPSSSSRQVLRDLINAGMNVARLNFSHGSHASHAKTFHLIREVAAECRRNVGIMADLQGPKIRTGALKNGAPVLLTDGAKVCITTRDVPGDATEISTTYTALASDLHEGDSIFLADGVLEFRVESLSDTDVHCTVVHGGYLGEHKGINLPGVNVSAPSLTKKDLADLEFATEIGVDFIALSFVRTAADVEDLRNRVAEKGKTCTIVAKIERPEALENFNAILDATDCVMLARGDLGVEVPLNELPQIQKRLIAQCNDLGVPIITATQMLESMINNVRPTRAEVADVANAVYDGTDALMLSGETASGNFPVEAVKVMSDIASEADEALKDAPSHDRIVRMRSSAIRKGQGAHGDAIGQAACRTADSIDATRIVCFTKMGYTATLIARYRPSVPVTAITLNEEARRRCSLVWGVDAVLSIEPCNTDELDEIVDTVLLENGLASVGDTVIIAAGVPLAVRTRTNMLKLHTVQSITKSSEET